jgi:hypothetical protein
MVIDSIIRSCPFRSVPNPNPIDSSLLRPATNIRTHTTMARKFFVGGNFKMNPCSTQEKIALVNLLNAATLDPKTGRFRAERCYFPLSYVRLTLTDIWQRWWYLRQHCTLSPLKISSGPISKWPLRTVITRIVGPSLER